MYTILIVEDDAVIAGEIKRHMEKWDYQAVCVRDFKAVLAEFAEVAPQLVLMDISLPYFSGYHWCAEIRKLSKVPIIFISSAADNMNIVMAVNMGGDDFIAKPFDMDVLMAKITALMRRTYDFQEPLGMMEHKGAMLNMGDATLTYQEKRMELTKNEFRILAKLMEYKGTTVSRDTLMLALWETDSFVDDNTLSVNVNRLRRKLADIGLRDFIVTKKGEGYRVE